MNVQPFHKHSTEDRHRLGWPGEHKIWVAFVNRKLALQQLSSDPSHLSIPLFDNAHRAYPLNVVIMPCPTSRTQRATCAEIVAAPRMTDSCAAKKRRGARAHNRECSYQFLESPQ
jgi:hypothetical protein